MVIDRLKDRLAEINDLENAAAVLSWDQQTYMPPGGAEARAEQLATLARLAHERFVSEEMRELLDEAARQTDLSADDDRAALLRVTRRDFDRAVKLPADLV